MPDANIELRGQAPKPLVDVLDALSSHRRISRWDLITEILEHWADDKIAETGKFPFPTRELAEASAVRMRKRKSQHQAAQTYRCHHCGKWHIGGSRPAYVVHSTQNFKRRRREAGEVGGEE